MIGLVKVGNVVVQQNASLFTSPLRLRVQFEAREDLLSDLEWRLVYIGSPKDQKYDQVLDQFSMEGLKAGHMQFTIESNPPDPALIPSPDDLLGVTALIFSAYYEKQQFYRIAFYVYNYLEEEQPPGTPLCLSRVWRSVLTDKPRSFQFPINWAAKKDRSQDSTSEQVQSSLHDNFEAVPA